MYFNNDKSSTNIDDEFEKENILSRILKFLSKYKLVVFIGIAIILIVLMIVLFINRKITDYLILNGEENITLYQGTDYVEPGFDAYNSKDEDLNADVEIRSTLDMSKIGEYEITYTIGDVTKIRKINVIAKPEEYTYIYLKTINNSVNVYVKLNETYTEPGYQVFSSTGQDLTSKVKVTGTVDTSKKGNYKLIYSIVDSNGVTVSASRTVIVMDTEISLSLSPEGYTNKDVTINIGIADNYFDYILLPDNTKVTNSTYSYKVSSNGKYTFKVYNKKGVEKESSIEVKNIDKEAPTGSCTIDQDQNGSFITINASDASGIKKYEYNNKAYTNNKINLTTFINSAKITVYDNADNSKEISCTVVPKVYISNITKDGVIVTINAKKVNNDIAGYYFSYTNKRPDKSSSSYIKTTNESIDLVRLPGTTYVWVEDKVGKISEYKTITVSNDDLLITSGSGYKILENMKLSTYLSNQGWSIEELNKLIARSVRAAGLYTKEAAVTSAVGFQTVLAQKYKIKLPYWWGGKSWDFGADSNWGTSRYTESENAKYYYYGLDCSGFVGWAYVNAGYDVKNSGVSKYPRFWYWKRLSFNEKNGEAGDFLVNEGHVKLIIGKTSDGFITAEAKGKAYGMVVDIHKYSKPDSYKIVKADNLMEEYDRISMSDCPSGF